MKSYRKILIAISVLFISFPLSAQDSFKMGYVNAKKCIEKSKYGKREKTAFETLRKQLGDNLEKADKELNELAKKLEDQEYMDGLSSPAAEELKQKFQKSSQEFVRYQNQYYQLLNQANVKLLQNLNNIICESSDKVRKDKNLNVVFNDEAIFSVDPSYDISEEIVKKMDDRFEQESKNQAEVK